jgi:hypothetical protein
MASLPATKKKPRLSLQIQTNGSSPSRASRGHVVDSKDPTAFNTLSNAYQTAIERSAQAQSEPLTAINTLQAFSLVTPIDVPDPKRRVVTPYVANYPETPLTAHASSPRPLEINYPSMMTATPPLSGTMDSNESKVFTFSSTEARKVAEGRSFDRSAEPRVMQRLSIPRAGALLGGLPPPYTPSRATHSILRNSPLPPRTAIPPPSPRRQSLRLQEKAARRVGYNSPLEQEIVTLKYTKSHIDLLAEEASPNSPAGLPSGPEDVLDIALAFTANEIQDGGQTPGPFEETRRRVAGFVSPATPAAAAGGIRKRKRKEKKRRWVWTIGQEEDEDDETIGGAVAAIRAEAARNKAHVKTGAGDGLASQVPSVAFMDETPTPSVESSDSWHDYRDVVMSDTSSVTSEDTADDREDSLQPGNMDIDLKTPTAPKQDGDGRDKKQAQRDTPIPELSNRDTPIPPEVAGPKRDTPVPPEYIY